MGHTRLLSSTRRMEIPRGEVLEEQLFFMGKRLLDLVLALTFILCFLPFYLILAIITFASSRGPVIYRQERVGKNGHAFTMYKFRTMRAPRPDEEMFRSDAQRVT